MNSTDLSSELSMKYCENLENLFRFQEKYTPLIIDIADSKIQFFRKLLNAQYSNAN